MLDKKEEEGAGRVPDKKERKKEKKLERKKEATQAGCRTKKKEKKEKEEEGATRAGCRRGRRLGMGGLSPCHTLLSAPGKKYHHLCLFSLVPP